MGLYDYTLYSIIMRNSRVYNNRPALISGNQKISHYQFLQLVNKVGRGLLESGVEKGDRIAIFALNSLEYVYLYGAAARIGAIIVPINWRLKPKEIEDIILDASPKILFVSSEFQAMIIQLIPKLGFIEKNYAMGQAKGDFIAFNELMENDGICPGLDVHSNDAYVIMHYAAATGKPRGVTMSQRGLISFNLQAMYCLSLTEQDLNLCMLPLFHLGGLGSILNVMQAGGASIIIPKFDIDHALKHIHEDKVTFFMEFPPMLEALLDKAQEGNYDLSSLRLALGLDNPDAARRFEEMTGGAFWAAYGQSEVSGLVSMSPYFERTGSVGRPGFMAEIEIMDDYGNILEIGETGEIVVRGPVVFNGYWNLPEDNEYTFRDGWHHTGDMGRFDEDGFLFYAGRKAEKELVKPGGENVYPAEIEKVVIEHPLVDEVSVIGVPNKKWGEAIKAICVLKPGETLTEDELIEFVAARIARYKKPKYVAFVTHLPKTKDGLIDRERVKADYGEV
jgi:acyl-CoA synthetase (AMP-forming)/AMP-acid ligase II